MPLKTTVSRLSVPAIAVTALALGATSAVSAHAASQLRAEVLLAGSSLHHTFAPAGSRAAKSEALTQPDDITMLNGNLFVTFQNDVGPQGTPSPSGNVDSTIVEISPTGHAV